MEENYVSRMGSSGESTGFDIIYTVMNNDLSYLNELDATGYVLQNKPGSYAGYGYLSYEIKQVVRGVYTFTLKYGTPGNATMMDIGTLSFNVGGGTAHITNSISYTSVRDTAILPDPMDYGGAIGVEVNDDKTKGRIRGLDIVAPVMEYSWATQFTAADVNDGYINDVFNLCGTINGAAFFGRPAGSVLFKGARGSRKGFDRWELSFDFAYSPNMTNIAVGNMTVTAKKGWDYLDILYIPQPRVNFVRMLTPGMATVHKVYQDGNFELLKISPRSEPPFVLPTFPALAPQSLT